MNNISVPSRFACLKIEDDDSKPATSARNNSSNHNKKNMNKKKPNNKKVNSHTQSSVPSFDSKQTTSKKNKNTKKSDKQQWEEWKQKDNELVDGNFNQDIADAMIASKLEYDAKTNENMNGVIKTSENDGVVVNKKKKTKTMYLDQFLEMTSNSTSTTVKNDVFVDADVIEKKIRENIKKQEIKDKIEEQRKERETNIDSILTISQIQEKLLQEQAKNALLEEQLENVKADIVAIKQRNKTLCSLLAQIEVNDQVDILLELERLNLVKDELTEEIRKLHKLLEQERSKVSAVDFKKDKKHRKKE